MDAETLGRILDEWVPHIPYDDPASSCRPDALCEAHAAVAAEQRRLRLVAQLALGLMEDEAVSHAGTCSRRRARAARASSTVWCSSSLQAQ